MTTNTQPGFHPINLSIHPRNDQTQQSLQVIGGLGGAFLAKSLLAPNLLGDPSFTLTGGNLLVETFFSFSLMLTVFQTTVRTVCVLSIGLIGWGVVVARRTRPDQPLRDCRLTDRPYMPPLISH